MNDNQEVESLSEVQIETPIEPVEAPVITEPETVTDSAAATSEGAAPQAEPPIDNYESEVIETLRNNAAVKPNTQSTAIESAVKAAVDEYISKLSDGTVPKIMPPSRSYDYSAPKKPDSIEQASEIARKLFEN